MTFTGSDIDALLRYMNIAFDTAPGGGPVDWTRLSDGQQSLLYLTIVLALHGLGTQVLARKVPTVDPAKLRPAAFTLIALEEPENSLSPHYTRPGPWSPSARFSRHPDAQVIVATHSPSVVRRVPGSSIRHLRLDTSRRSVVTTIKLPPESAEAYKFVREAVEAFPELYFARLVMLGEGDSEQIVLPRMLEAAGVSADLSCISVVPLGGRHVNHFWRLLGGLGIPYLTLLDLDTARFGGGWGRVHYALDQLLKYPTARAIEKRLEQAHMDAHTRMGRPWSNWLTHPATGRLCWISSRAAASTSPRRWISTSLCSAPTRMPTISTDRMSLRPMTDTLTAVLGKGRKLEAEQYRRSRAHYSPNITGCSVKAANRSSTSPRCRTCPTRHCSLRSLQSCPA